MTDTDIAEMKKICMEWIIRRRALEIRIRNDIDAAIQVLETDPEGVAIIVEYWLSQNIEKICSAELSAMLKYLRSAAANAIGMTMIK